MTSPFLLVIINRNDNKVEEEDDNNNNKNIVWTIDYWLEGPGIGIRWGRGFALEHCFPNLLVRQTPYKFCVPPSSYLCAIEGGTLGHITMTFKAEIFTNKRTGNVKPFS